MNFMNSDNMTFSDNLGEIKEEDNADNISSRDSSTISVASTPRAASNASRTVSNASAMQSAKVSEVERNHPVAVPAEPEVCPLQPTQ